MFSTPPRLALCAAALLLVGASCSTRAESFELERIVKADVKVLPGADGFVHPLTGVTSYTPQDWQKRPALAIKVGNSGAERPQAGLDRADLIYEELVEGGITRFMAIFSTNQAPRVGPVRSVRTVDHKILQPIGGLFGYSGGVPPVVSELRETPGVQDVGADVASGAYRRDSSRQQPYNLYTSTDQLWSGREKAGPPPKPLFSYIATDEDPTSGGDEVANDVKLSFAGNGSQIHYVFDKETGEYLRSNNDAPHTVEGEGDDGVQLSFRNVLVQMVQTSSGSTVDRAGLRTTDTSLIGSGSAVLFRGGRALRGSWSRASAGEITQYIDASGGPLKLAPGETIVELVPAGRDLFVN
jgi:hypothetical protein